MENFELRISDLLQFSWKIFSSATIGLITICGKNRHFFEKNRIFANAFLDVHQFAIYDEVERSVVPHIVDPHTVIYITDRIETCHERIIRRGRDFEKPITIDRPGLTVRANRW